MEALKLVLKRKWWDMIASGEKKEEYREITPYWQTRIDNVTTRIYSVVGQNPHFEPCVITQMENLYSPVTFYLGYAKDRPSMTFQVTKIEVGEGRPEWGAEPGKNYYVIKLGERI